MHTACGKNFTSNEFPKKSDSKSNKIRQADFLELNFIISALRARHLLLIYLRATAISISVKLSKLI